MKETATSDRQNRAFKLYRRRTHQQSQHFAKRLRARSTGAVWLLLVLLTWAQAVHGRGLVKAHRAAVHDLAFASDGKSLASCGKDGVKVWSLDKDRSSQYVSAEKHRSIALADDVLFGAGLRGISTWDFGEEKAYRGGRRRFATIRYNEKRELLVAAHAEGLVLLGKQDIELFSLPDAPTEIAVSADGETLAHVTQAGRLVQQSIAENLQLGSATTVAQKAEHIAFCKSNLCYSRGAALFMDGELVVTHSSKISALTGDKEGLYIASGHHNGDLFIHHAKTQHHLNFSDAITCLAISNEAQLLAAGTSKGAIYLVNLRDFRPTGQVFDVKCTRVNVSLWIVRSKRAEFVVAWPIGKELDEGTLMVRSYQRYLRQLILQQQIAMRYRQMLAYQQYLASFQAQSYADSYSSGESYSYAYEIQVPVWTTHTIVTYELVPY